jgi:hypothetical protein
MSSPSLSFCQNSVTIWEPIDSEWCLPRSTDPAASQFHLQLDHGTITRIAPLLDMHRALQNDVRSAIQRALANPHDAFSEGCLVHGTARAPRNWWHRRLLQHTPDLLAEATGSSVILYYKNLAIILSQSSVKTLHRSFVTRVNASKFDLVSEVDAIIAFRQLAHKMLSPNPLTAAFQATPQAAPGVTSIAGKIAFRHFLDTNMADLLAGASGAQVRAITRTVGQPNLPLQPHDEALGNDMIDIIRTMPAWANWESCC